MASQTPILHHPNDTLNPTLKTKMQALLRRGTSYLTPSSSTSALSQISANDSAFNTAPEGSLFPTVDPAIDGEECLRDCDSCTIHYPNKFSIDEGEKLYGMVKGWSTHLLVATGKTDWVRDVEDEKGSVMEAVGKVGTKLKNGRVMLSASNIPLPDPDPSTAEHKSPTDASQIPTTTILLPAFTVISNVTPASVPELLSHIVSTAPTTTTPLNPTSTPTPPENTTEPTASDSQPNGVTPSIPPSLTSTGHPFDISPCPHRALILLCSQKTRDARCGQSAPLLRREFERQLRPLDLYRDLHDTRPGGVGIYFISHVGGHKFAANVMIYRRDGFAAEKNETNGTAEHKLANGVEKMALEEKTEEEEDKGAAQGIWLARVRPEDCEGIIRYTVLQGKIVKPQRQLRGGFDRRKGLVSW